MGLRYQKYVLVLLTSVNYLNYIDRYILAALLVSIKADLGLSDFQAGLLATAFMIPYMFTSPIFGWLGDTRDRSKILSMGAAVWSLASLATGFAKNLSVMMMARFTLGLGESAFTVTSIPFISEHFTKEKQGRTLAIFSTALPVGAALGYVLGGWLGHAVGWRSAFFIVGFPGLILAYFIWKLPDPRQMASNSHYDFKKTFTGLFRSQNYFLTVLGYCAYSFVVGGVAHWIPTYLQRAYEVDQMKANLLFGGVAVGCGLIGTMSGGFLGDLMNRKKGGGHLRVSSYSMFLSVPFFILCMQASNLTEFTFYLSFAQFLFFISTSPINAAIIEAAPAHLRTSATALAVFACHILGDAISAPLIGYVSDQTSSLKTGILICTPVILVSAGMWAAASRTAIKQVS